MAEKRLLEQRKHVKARKPKYSMQDAHKHKRLASKWRKPRGLQSKIRLHKRGYNKNVTKGKGYGSPAEVKHLHVSGLTMKRVCSEKELRALHSEQDGIILGRVGLKNKLNLIKQAIEKKFTFINIKDPQAYLKQAEDMLAQKKQKKAEKKKKKQESKEKLKKEAEKKEKKEKEKAEKEESKKSTEDKKEAEKKELDKVLTKKS
jgi:large subunit ribosomal protein L32e